MLLMASRKAEMMKLIIDESFFPLRTASSMRLAMNLRDPPENES
jgi:hypothetical protein